MGKLWNIIDYREKKEYKQNIVRYFKLCKLESSGIRKNVSDLLDIDIPSDAYKKNTREVSTSQQRKSSQNIKIHLIKSKLIKKQNKFELASQFIKAAKPIIEDHLTRENCAPTWNRKKLFQKWLDLSEKIIQLQTDLGEAQTIIKTLESKLQLAKQEVKS